MNRPEFLHSQRLEAWRAARSLRDRLLVDYCDKYGLSEAPAPAKIVGELIPEFLGASINYVPLGTNVFAETEWLAEETVVRVNSRTWAMPGVKDVQGVQNVALWHEAVHIVEHGPGSPGPQQTLAGFEPPLRYVCRRGEKVYQSSAQTAKEFRAEEGGRAAAVSMVHLKRSPAFRRLLEQHSRLTNSSAWGCLRQAANDIGVNISALVTQLQLEGLIVVEVSGGRRLLHVQPALTSSTGVAR